MARRQGREQRRRERAAGYAPHGEVVRVKRAVSQVYDGLYTVQFERRLLDGLRLYKAYLHSATGPVVRAVVYPGDPDIEVGTGAHSERVRMSKVEHVGLRGRHRP